ncbi:MAG: hypothetical protein QM612_03405 [Thermomonas sp.]|uniref:hypothetical protein n=1 Tax=Thermomonas sp. TaxID=1971895 RepID=UPI0039E2DCFA
MATPQHPKANGAVWIVIGAAFLAISATGQMGFLGVGLALIVLGIVFMAKGRNDDKDKGPRP